MHKLPVTVITGFLGAGKTTLIRNLLLNNQGRRIAVLVNEFGEVGIDGELLRSCGVCDEEETADSNILELANGCLCCTVQEEFLPTMQTLLQRREQIDCILIETSGLALPKPLVQAFRWPEIRTGATVDGVVTLVDAVAVAAGQFATDLDALEEQRQADDSLDHEMPIEELFEDQLACADLVLLSKIDCLPQEDSDRVRRWLSTQVRSGVPIVPVTNGQLEPNVLLGFNAAVEDDLEQRPSHHDHEEDHDHDDAIAAVHLSLDSEWQPEALVERLQALQQSQTLYRVKGFLAVPGKSMRLVFQGVGPRFDWFYDRPWRSPAERRSQLVFIGEDLNAEVLQSALTPVAAG
ncbi:cobalamin biosynthesis protein CobW [Synechococcus elongatus]|uniref:Cobalamin biosynthesis protein CobW n=1 Tax=Synechococcus elongatus PCC 11802 TaxID=2283154 RepID=A0AAU6R5M7_SYNEL|nr:cobalamin biosynthesis protein CobW [Synechococcus elongatus]QFZ93061.1 cobalamin biosynthesis protein CobW [Synechococcus elongatus PCC 11802]